ncbi:MAG: hypothetical protein K0R57_2717 [Paenibacillaceae bacterium]|jgi:beta-galactosidase GanA|nr:hypothetical protein [Paenibacillaceae bacterium]
MATDKRAFPYGAVYRIQRQETWEDISGVLLQMKQAGMNTAVIWPAVYWWEDRSLPDYPYHTGRRILQYAEEIGLQIIMELSGQITSLEYAPDFLMKEEYYAIGYDGAVRRDFRFFGYLNYNHPEVRQLIEQQFAEAARHYKDYSSLYGYDIWNETMFESYDSFTLQAFRTWLKARYGTIAALNDAWDRVYHDFSQIHFNRWTWASVMPEVDYHRFQKESIGRFLREWGQAVKAVDPVHPLIADNIHATVASDSSYDRPQDDWNVAEAVDEYGISFYPKDRHGTMEPWKRALVLAGAHSASTTGRFWISELQTHMRHMFDPTSVVRPGELRQWVWESLAHGAKGLIYWKWDPFPAGLQTGARGLVDHARQGTPRLAEASAIARSIAAHERELALWEPERARALILFDKSSHDFTKAILANYKASVPDSIYLDGLGGLYRVLWELNIPVRFVTAEDVLAGLPEADQTLFITGQLNMDRELADALKLFMEKGGTVVADGKFGEVDNLGLLHRQQPGGPLHGMLGVDLVDVEPDGLEMEWHNGGELAVDGLKGFFERKLLKPVGSAVEVAASYADGAPAITRSPCGHGHLLYISTLLWYGYQQQQAPATKAFAARLAEVYGLKPQAELDAPSLKLAVLEGEAGRLVFLFNYSTVTVDASLRLAVDWPEAVVTNLHTGASTVIKAADERDGRYSGENERAALNFPVQVPAGDVLVLKWEKNSGEAQTDGQ